MLSVGHVTITNTHPSKKNVYPWWPEDIGYQFLLSIHIHATKEFTLCRAFGYHKHKFPLKIDQGFLITREAINIRKNISILLVLISLKLDLANRSTNLWWHSDNYLWCATESWGCSWRFYSLFTQSKVCQNNMTLPGKKHCKTPVFTLTDCSKLIVEIGKTLSIANK